MDETTASDGDKGSPSAPTVQVVAHLLSGKTIVGRVNEVTTPHFEGLIAESSPQRSQFCRVLAAHASGESGHLEIPTDDGIILLSGDRIDYLEIKIVRAQPV